MILDTVLTPAEIERLPERDLHNTFCVVFDILRATSSVVTGFAHGIHSIVPVETIAEALEWRTRRPDLLLAGERHGDRIEGFEIGNSPAEFTLHAGKNLVHTTTNGTIAIRACAKARTVVAGALLNLDALERAVQNAGVEEILLICAGTFRNFALEDGYAAGRLAERLTGATQTDATRAMVALSCKFEGNAEAALRASQNGQRLLATGREADVRWCAQTSIYEVIPTLEGEALRCLP